MVKPVAPPTTPPGMAPKPVTPPGMAPKPVMPPPGVKPPPTAPPVAPKPAPGTGAVPPPGAPGKLPVNFAWPPFPQAPPPAVAACQGKVSSGVAKAPANMQPKAAFKLMTICLSSGGVFLPNFHGTPQLSGKANACKSSTKGAMPAFGECLRKVACEAHFPAGSPMAGACIKPPVVNGEEQIP